MNKSESIAKLAESLCKAQSEMTNPHFDSTNPHFKSPYASLASVRDAVIPVLAKNGLSVSQFLSNTPTGDVMCETMLLHTSGEWLASMFSIPSLKKDAHGIGAAGTYARRYSLQAIVCVVGDTDDDGNIATSQPAYREPSKNAAPVNKPVPPKTPQSKPETKPTLSQDDSMSVARTLAAFAETQCYEDFNAICAMLKEPNSAVNTADNPQAVREAILAGIKGHKHSKPVVIDKEQEEQAA